MKKLLFMFSFLINLLGLSAAKVQVDRIEPTNWFVGMKNTHLQLMVYGQGITNAKVEVDYPGVTVEDLVRLESDNYLLVYLDVSPSAKAGTMQLKFTDGKKKKVVDYQLLERKVNPADRHGFTSEDVLYMLMPDRFADGNPQIDVVKGMRDEVCDRNAHSMRHGGDLKGIRDHLDYFTDLGVTALWFTPVLENDMPADHGQYSSYHGYATTNYYRVDPRFGTNDEYRQLIDDCHSRGLKVVMDMIFNHCGSYHPWLLDMPSKDWFNASDYKNNYLQTSYRLTPVMDPYASKIDLKETVEGWFVRSMPDLNQKNQHVMRYLIQNSKWWIETVGIDGIRMDTYPYADFDTMAQWMKEINEEYPDFNVVGETWNIDTPFTASWQMNSRLTKRNSHLKTVMDFSFYDKITKASNQNTTDQYSGLEQIYNNFVYDYLYEDPFHVMAFIENHDTDRFLGEGKDVPMLKQACAILLTAPRIPQLYYGTEVLMNGVKKVSDGYVRCDFSGGWAGDTQNKFTAEGRTTEENDMFNYLRTILHWRKGNKAITQGKMVQFIPRDGVYVYARSFGGKTVLVVLNGNTKTAQADMSRYAEVTEGFTQGKDVTTGSVFPLNAPLTLAPRQSLILDLQ